MQKILYLDYDGVLHDEHVYYHPRQGIYIKTPGRSLFEWMPVLEDLLAPYPDVAIVLSTSWVRVRSFNYAKKQLSQMLRERVIGATYHRHYMRQDDFAALPRGAQIAQDVQRRQTSSWLALDDEYQDWPEWCRDNLIKTNGALGVSDPAVQDAMQLRLQRL